MLYDRGERTTFVTILDRAKWTGRSSQCHPRNCRPLQRGGALRVEGSLAAAISDRWHDVVGRTCPVAAAGHLRAQGGGSAESRLSSERTFRFCVIDRCG